MVKRQSASFQLFDVFEGGERDAICSASSTSLANPETKAAACVCERAARHLITGSSLKRCFVMTTASDPCLQSTSSVDNASIRNFSTFFGRLLGVSEVIQTDFGSGIQDFRFRIRDIEWKRI